jgi:hypothetical protein
MNRSDEHWRRLFRAAREHAAPAAWPIPFGLETRVVAAWRERETADFWTTPLLVRGLALAALIMALSVCPLLTRTTNPFSESLQLVDSAATVDVTP